MNIIVCESYQKMSEAAAMILATQVMTKPDSVLGLPTGATPLGVYEELVHTHLEGLLDFKWIRFLLADEAVGAGRDTPGGARERISTGFVSRVNADPENLIAPDGEAASLEAECELYEERIERLGGVDLQLLEIGADGALGYNRPGQCFEPSTHVTRVARAAVAAHAVQAAHTRRLAHDVTGGGIESGNGGHGGHGGNGNHGAHGDHNGGVAGVAGGGGIQLQTEIDAKAITIGVGTILKAARVVLVASGADKASAVRDMVFGKVRPGSPASVLQFHRDVTVITDGEAGGAL